MNGSVAAPLILPAAILPAAKQSVEDAHETDALESTGGEVGSARCQLQLLSRHAGAPQSGNLKEPTLVFHLTPFSA
jgi:hypothetical protein